MRKIKVSELVEDLDIYPRGQVDSSHVRYLGMALQGGASLPPPVIDRRSKRIIDGFHRCRCYRRIDENMEIDVIEKSYKSDADMFREAVRLNAHHGRNLSPYDRTRCVIIAERLGITVDQIASELSMTVEAIGELRMERTGRMTVAGINSAVPLKRTIRHMHGRQLTERQAEANERLGGMNQLFYVNQIIELIESGLLDTSNEKLMERLRYLIDLIGKIEGFAA